jgi:hemerythrin superfamily protein
MAHAKKTARKSVRTRSASAHKPAGNDAVAILKADHRQVEKWFDACLAARAQTRKQDFAQKICQALRIHTEIEHEIFYPAFLEATDEEDIHHEAEIEHESAKKLIAEIERCAPEDEYYDARIKVLSEMIKHHVNEEEKRDGMFAKARHSRMDLRALGEQLASRKAQLMASEADTEEQGGSAAASHNSNESNERIGSDSRVAARR